MTTQQFPKLQLAVRMAIKRVLGGATYSNQIQDEVCRSICSITTLKLHNDIDDQNHLPETLWRMFKVPHAKFPISTSFEN